MFVAEDGFGSSLRDWGDIPEVKARVTVPQRRLGEYAAERRLPPPDVIKIDSQGAEDIILKGAGRLLDTVKVFFLECWLVCGYGPETSLLGEKSFTLVEFGERFYDEKRRLYSVDTVFFAESFLREYPLSPESAWTKRWIGSRVKGVAAWWHPVWDKCSQLLRRKCLGPALFRRCVFPCGRVLA